jgi:metal-responsive CopG/Arc/MetJ family transcriptional regulator
MRALVDIPDGLIKDLATISETKKLPRAEIIRRAISAYIADNKPTAELAFGLWANNKIDGLEYQEKVRSEW